MEILPTGEDAIYYMYSIITQSVVALPLRRVAIQAVQWVGSKSLERPCNYRGLRQVLAMWWWLSSQQQVLRYIGVFGRVSCREAGNYLGIHKVHPLRVKHNRLP